MIPYYFLGPLFGSSYSCLIIVSFFQSCGTERSFPSCVNGEIFLFVDSQSEEKRVGRETGVGDRRLSL